MPLTPEQARRAVTALHRFGLGAKPGVLTSELARDPSALSAAKPMTRPGSLSRMTLF